MQIHIARVKGSSIVWGCLLHTDGLLRPTLVTASEYLLTERQSRLLDLARSIIHRSSAWIWANICFLHYTSRLILLSHVPSEYIL